jgi:hypothetical protein
MNLIFQGSNPRFSVLAVICVAGLILSVSSGCDRRSGPQSKVPPTSMPELAPRPTMQALLSEPLHRFVVPGIPLSIQAPRSWKIDNASHLTVLEGPTPSQDMMIQIAARDAIKPTDVDLFIEHMRRESDTAPGDLKRTDLRNQGKAQVIEQLYEEKPLSSPRTDTSGLAVVDGKGNIQMTTVKPIHWMVTILVPGPNAYEHYDINCIGLTSEEYASDKELLEKIMASVVYEQALAPTTAP